MKTRLIAFIARYGIAKEVPFSRLAVAELLGGSPSDASEAAWARLPGKTQDRLRSVGWDETVFIPEAHRNRE